MTINIDEELDEEFLETGDENIYWSIADVSVEKENKNITYHGNLDISVLADLIFRKMAVILMMQVKLLCTDRKNRNINGRIFNR